MENNTHYDVIVMGGGASGMMAAGAASMRGKKVLILEKNRVIGEKLGITGGGRCNITNAEFDIHEMLAHYGDAKPFLYSPFAQFGVQSTFDFFEARNCPIVVEARKRAFPKSQKATDVVRVMHKFVTNPHVTIKTGHSVSEIIRKDNKIVGVRAKGTLFTADSYIISVGGASHPETGSTGDGFKWLADIGHTVKKPSPNIVPLRVDDEWVHNLSGTSLSFMKITFFADGKKAFSKEGKILFTHFGLSGPLILNSAKQVADLLEWSKVTATIDCYPDTDLGALDKKILKIFDDNKNRDFKNILKDIVPEGLSTVLTDLKIIADPTTKVHSISKEDRKKIVHTLKALPLTVAGLMGMDRAVVSDGGVTLEEVDTKTMRSKVFSNLLFTGDILHINRPSGGFSLQLCWTTGWVAGQNA
jgi:predicted Rossmann fold flavoprotein